MENKFSNRGSAVVETLLSLTLITALIAGSLSLSYLGFAHFWIKYQLYETLICLHSQSGVNECRSRLKTQINDVLRFGKLSNLQIYSTPEITSGISGYLYTVDVSFHISDHLRVRKRSSLRSSDLLSGVSM